MPPGMLHHPPPSPGTPHHTNLACRILPNLPDWPQSTTLAVTKPCTACSACLLSSPSVAPLSPAFVNRFLLFPPPSPLLLRCLCSVPHGLRMPAVLRELHLESNALTGGLPDLELVALEVGGEGLHPAVGKVLQSLVMLLQLPATDMLASCCAPHLHQVGDPIQSPFAAGCPTCNSFPLSLPQVLNLAGNQLTAIPANLGTSGSLRTLNLSSNQLGALPPGLQLPHQLESLDLGGNQLQGPLPRGQALPQTLIALSLGSNRLTGPLEALLPLPGRLEVLLLENNTLSGSLASLLSGLPSSLTALNLGHNHLRGELPQGLQLPPGLLSLALNDNQLQGGVPGDWRLANGARVDLRRNNLTGVHGEGPSMLGSVPLQQVWRQQLGGGAWKGYGVGSLGWVGMG